MFFGRIVRNIFIFLIGFLLVINVYYWSMSINPDYGTGKFQFVGFYNFFKNFENMPKFEVFLASVNKFRNFFTEWTAGQTVLAIITGGISFIAQTLARFSEMLIMLVVEFFRYLIWLFGFIGVQTN